MADDPHDRPPEPRQVDNVAPRVDGAHDAARDLVGACPQRPLVETGRHRRIDETRLDRQHLDPVLEHAVAQPLQEQAHHALGRAIDVIALAATVAGHRGNHRQRPLFLPGKTVGDQRRQRDHRQRIGLDLGQRQVDRKFTGALIGQGPVCDQRHVDAAQEIVGGRQHRLMLTALAGVHDLRFDPRRTAYLKIVGDAHEPFGITPDEVERRAARRPEAGCGFSNRRGGADDQYFLHVSDYPKRLKSR